METILDLLGIASIGFVLTIVAIFAYRGVKEFIIAIREFVEEHNIKVVGQNEKLEFRDTIKSFDWLTETLDNFEEELLFIRERTVDEELIGKITTFLREIKGTKYEIKSIVKDLYNSADNRNRILRLRDYLQEFETKVAGYKESVATLGNSIVKI